MKLLEDEDTYIKACIYGTTGTGKTTLAVTAEDPLVLLSETQGLASLRDAAKRLGIERPAALHMQKPDDYRLVLDALKRGPHEKDGMLHLAVGDGIHLPWPKTIIIDSLTDLARLVEAEIEKEAPYKSGRDGLAVKSMAHWGSQSDRIRKLVFEFRDLPMHVVFLALQDEREDFIAPMISTKKLAEQLPASVNIVGNTMRLMNEDGTERFGVRFRGPDNYSLKAMRALRATEPADLASIINRCLQA